MASLPHGPDSVTQRDFFDRHETAFLLQYIRCARPHVFGRQQLECGAAQAEGCIKAIKGISLPNLAISTSDPLSSKFTYFRQSVFLLCFACAFSLRVASFEIPLDVLLLMRILRANLRELMTPICRSRSSVLRVLFRTRRC